MRLYLLWVLIFALLPAQVRAQDQAPVAPPQAAPVYIWHADPSVGVETRLVTVTLPAVLPTAAHNPALPVVVVVDKSNHMTRVLQVRKTDEAEELVEVLAIPNANGKRSTPTPNGRTTVRSKELDPVWTPPVSIDPLQRSVAPYSKTKKNPLGVAWIGTHKGSIGLHGTNAPTSIGKSVSHGCVRHQNDDILKLYALVEVGTPIYFAVKMDGTQVRVSDFDPKPTK